MNEEVRNCFEQATKDTKHTTNKTYRCRFYVKGKSERERDICIPELTTYSSILPKIGMTYNICGNIGKVSSVTIVVDKSEEYIAVWLG